MTRTCIRDKREVILGRVPDPDLVVWDNGWKFRLTEFGIFFVSTIKKADHELSFIGTSSGVDLLLIHAWHFILLLCQREKDPIGLYPEFQNLEMYSDSNNFYIAYQV